MSRSWNLSPWSGESGERAERAVREAQVGCGVRSRSLKGGASEARDGAWPALGPGREAGKQIGKAGAQRGLLPVQSTGHPEAPGSRAPVI